LTLLAPSGREGEEFDELGEDVFPIGPIEGQGELGSK
jgi:hypothetical protein